MKKDMTNSKNTVSKTERGLKHLRLVGIGREYVEGRLDEMQRNTVPEALTFKGPSLKTNGRKDGK